MEWLRVFVFSPRYRLLRHILFWSVHVPVFSFLFKAPELPYGVQHFLSALWVPVFILYSYPLMYWAIPKILFREKYGQFVGLLVLWGIGGYFLNYAMRKFILFPIAEAIGYSTLIKNPFAPTSFLAMNVMAGYASMIAMFKYWMEKQRAFLSEEKEKVQAELSLLKAQIHPHFLFNTLNNIYSFSLQGSSNTPAMLLQLSALLSYVLYDCRGDRVSLRGEYEMMQNYIGLEKERYANRLESSIGVSGDMDGYKVAPLLLLPILENVFKHGTSEQLDKPWFSIELVIKQGRLFCKFVNSKSEGTVSATGGIGLSNLRKRLGYLYPGNHELLIHDELDVFVVELDIPLEGESGGPPRS